MSGSHALLRLLPLLLALAAAAPIAAAEKPLVTDARSGVHPDKTRFVLEISRPFKLHKLFTLANPYRVVIDLPQLAWDPKIPEHQPGAGVIERFRFGRFRPDTSRVVLDVKLPVRIKGQSVLTPRDGHRYRLVIDLEPVSPEVFQRERRSANRAIAPTPSAIPAALRPPLPSAKPAKPVIVIDPGHGGIDPGATRGRRVYEKHITLAVARRIKKELEKSGRYGVLLTRDGDIFMSLRDRVRVAQRRLADLFISIHADSIRKRRVRGASVYTLSDKASDQEAEALAQRENKADLLAGVGSLESYDANTVSQLVSLAQNKAKERAIHFSWWLVQELRRGKMKLLRKPRRSAGFVVLKAPEVPSVLFELGYLSNKRDARQLGSAKHQAKVARAVGRAVDRYFADPISANY